MAYQVKKEYLGQKLFIRSIGRTVIIENNSTLVLLTNGLTEYLEPKEPKQKEALDNVNKPKKEPSKRNSSNANGTNDN
jgi:hypothetical protein